VGRFPLRYVIVVSLSQAMRNDDVVESFIYCVSHRFNAGTQQKRFCWLGEGGWREPAKSRKQRPIFPEIRYRWLLSKVQTSTDDSGSRQPSNKHCERTSKLLCHFGIQRVNVPFTRAGLQHELEERAVESWHKVLHWNKTHDNGTTDQRSRSKELQTRDKRFKFTTIVTRSFNN
jgi:hypothetical protein